MILPTAAAAFKWIETRSGPALVCQALQPIAEHLFTSRSWRLGVRPGGIADPSAWADLAHELGIDNERLARVQQVHGAEVATIPQQLTSEIDADVMVSCDPGYGLAVRVADCVPLLLADRRTGAVAAAHAGWKGLAARVPIVAVKALASQYGCRSADILAVAGPSIGACCYEVGEAVRAAFENRGSSAHQLERWFLSAPTPTRENPSMAGLVVGRPSHWFFDGWRVTTDQLLEAGLLPENIFVAETCSASHPDAFCSYRRDGKGAGRLAAAIRPRVPRHP